MSQNATVVLDRCVEAVARGDGRELWSLADDDDAAIHHALESSLVLTGIDAQGENRVQLMNIDVVLAGQQGWLPAPNNELVWEKPAVGDGDLCLGVRGERAGTGNVAQGALATATASSEGHQPNEALDESLASYWASTEMHSAAPGDTVSDTVSDTGSDKDGSGIGFVKGGGGFPQIDFEISLDEAEQGVKSVRVEWEYPAMDFDVFVGPDPGLYDLIAEVRGNDEMVNELAVPGRLSDEVKQVKLVLRVPHPVNAKVAETAGRATFVYGIRELAVLKRLAKVVTMSCDKSEEFGDGRNFFFFAEVREFDPRLSLDLNKHTSSFLAQEKELGAKLSDLEEARQTSWKFCANDHREIALRVRNQRKDLAAVHHYLHLRALAASAGKSVCTRCQEALTNTHKDTGVPSHSFTPQPLSLATGAESISVVDGDGRAELPSSAGFYDVRPLCGKETLRLFCPFGVGIVTDYVRRATTGYRNERDIRTTCARKGLQPVQLSGGRFRLELLGDIVRRQGVCEEDRVEDGEVAKSGLVRPFVPPSGSIPSSGGFVPFAVSVSLEGDAWEDFAGNDVTTEIMNSAVFGDRFDGQELVGFRCVSGEIDFGSWQDGVVAAACNEEPLSVEYTEAPRMGPSDSLAANPFDLSVEIGSFSIVRCPNFPPPTQASIGAHSGSDSSSGEDSASTESVLVGNAATGWTHTSSICSAARQAGLYQLHRPDMGQDLMLKVIPAHGLGAYEGTLAFGVQSASMGPLATAWPLSFRVQPAFESCESFQATIDEDDKESRESRRQKQTLADFASAAQSSQASLEGEPGKEDAAELEGAAAPVGDLLDALGGRGRPEPSVDTQLYVRTLLDAQAEAMNSPISYSRLETLLKYSRGAQLATWAISKPTELLSMANSNQLSVLHAKIVQAELTLASTFAGVSAAFEGLKRQLDRGKRHLKYALSFSKQITPIRYASFYQDYSLQTIPLSQIVYGKFLVVERSDLKSPLTDKLNDPFFVQFHPEPARTSDAQLIPPLDRPQSSLAASSDGDTAVPPDPSTFNLPENLERFDGAEAALEGSLAIARDLRIYDGEISAKFYVSGAATPSGRFGLAFRCSSGSNFLLVSLLHTRVQVDRVVAGKASLIASMPYHLEPEAWIRVGVVSRRDRHRITVSNLQHSDADDDAVNEVSEVTEKDDNAASGETEVVGQLPTFVDFIFQHEENAGGGSVGVFIERSVVDASIIYGDLRRGRTYPCTPLFVPLGNDRASALAPPYTNWCSYVEDLTESSRQGGSTDIRAQWTPRSVSTFERPRRAGGEWIYMRNVLGRTTVLAQLTATRLDAGGSSKFAAHSDGEDHHRRGITKAASAFRAPFKQILKRAHLAPNIDEVSKPFINHKQFSWIADAIELKNHRGCGVGVASFQYFAPCPDAIVAALVLNNLWVIITAEGTRLFSEPPSIRGESHTQRVIKQISLPPGKAADTHTKSDPDPDVEGLHLSAAVSLKWFDGMHVYPQVKMKAGEWQEIVLKLKDNRVYISTGNADAAGKNVTAAFPIEVRLTTASNGKKAQLGRSEMATTEAEKGGHAAKLDGEAREADAGVECSREDLIARAQRTIGDHNYDDDRDPLASDQMSGGDAAALLTAKERACDAWEEANIPIVSLEELTVEPFRFGLATANCGGVAFSEIRLHPPTEMIEALKTRRGHSAAYKESASHA